MHQKKKIKLILERQIKLDKIKMNIQKQRNKFLKMKDFLKIKNNMLKILRKEKDLKFFEDFELLEYINSGSSGVVYKGLYLKAKKFICFKFLLNEFFSDKIVSNSKNSKYFEDINKLKSKNIVEYYKHINFKNIGCIIMEFAKFGDLENFQKILNKKRHFSETLLAFIAKQILNGLYILHQSKIIHMDIKPQNILIDEKLNFKITDFSVSFSYQNYNRNQKILLPLSGTNLYMSPEILFRLQIDYEDCCKIDIFSLGVVLYNLAFEKFPYELNYYCKDNLELILKKVKQNKLEIPKINGNYSYYFKKFLGGLLEKNIKKRISLKEALKDPWINGAELIFKEKEKINDLEKFLINLVTDNIKAFNDYINS